MNRLKFRWTSVAWSAAYLLLLLSLLTPFLVLTSLFLIVPAVVLFTTLNTRQFLAHILPVWIIVGFIHPVFVLLAIYMIIPALVMGRWYKKKRPATATLMAGTITILAEFLLLLLLGTTVFQFDLTDYVNNVLQMTNDIGASNPLLSDMVWTTEQVRQLSVLTVQMIPMTLILSSFMMAVITHSVTRPILNSIGYAVPKMRPAREWRLPRSIIWYYLIGIVIQMFSYNAQTGFMAMIAGNLLPLLRICFMIQAIGFLFFLAYEKKWSKAVPLLLAVPIILYPPLRIIGIVDLAFPLRELVTKSKR
ncbi:DUF2232 domain-containing protein [Paenibacillus sp. CN-4]|uniref:DUF2232 domain-containing protein n=1 Tax=Paenibacillus nanchangensis TaxID=3348343 RepID=UPI00397C7028